MASNSNTPAIKPPIVDPALFQQSRTAGNSFENSSERSSAQSTSTQASPAQLKTRARHVLWFGFRMVASFIWWELIAAKVIGHERVEATRMARFVTLARRFRKLALHLGGVWIKLGQFISSRVDLIPPQVVAELQGLQDAVPPEPPHVIQPIVEQGLGARIAEVFDEFDPHPIAAASFGQAHLAVLKARGAGDAHASPQSFPLPTSPRRVIVKVQRPNLDAIVNTDIGALKTIMRWLKRYKPIRRRADVDALVREFAKVIFEELDYEQEARSSEAFAKNFAKDPAVRVPKTYRATKRVLVQENVEEIKITDFEGLESAGISREQVAHKLFETYLQQIFVDGFFHADPHPGNLFVQPLDAQQARAIGMNNSVSSIKTAGGNAQPLNFSIPIVSNVINALTRPNQTALPTSHATPQRTGCSFRLIFIDFGMVSHITPATMRELKEIIIATGLKDARRLSAALQRMGFFTPEADVSRIEQAIGGLFDKVWGMNMNDLTKVEFNEMYGFAMQFRDLMSALPFQVPQNVLYLGRCTNILSGMCTALDPKFNPWVALQPFAQGMANSGNNLTPTLQDGFNEIVKLGRLSVQLPTQADAFMSRALNGQLELRAQLTPASTNELRRIETAVSRLTWALVLIACVACGSFLLVNGFGVVGALCFLIGLATLGRMVTL